jgi:hypothetical protein
MIISSEMIGGEATINQLFETISGISIAQRKPI